MMHRIHAAREITKAQENNRLRATPAGWLHTAL